MVAGIELVAFAVAGILALGVNLLAARTVFTLPQVVGALLVANALILLTVGSLAVLSDDKKQAK